MASGRDEGGAIAFGEKVLALLDQGRFTATYKYAVLLGLIDLCLEGVTAAGDAPQSVTTHQLAAKVLDLYWPHTVAYGATSPRVLHQNRGGRAELLQLITRFRATHAPDPSAPLGRSRHRAPAAHARLLREIEWKLVEMPLPRLQRFGVVEDRFIYELDWDLTIRRGDFNDAARFSNLLRFVDGAGDHLVRLAGLLRPLLQRRWAAEVARLNQDLIEDAALEAFLFGADRIALAPVADGLRELQDGRCFYCAGPLRQAQVDHFIPWARVPMNAIENLVVADATCNNAKHDHLAAAAHVEHWSTRSTRQAADLSTVARLASWDQAPDRVLGVARATYLRLSTSARLWDGASTFVAADPARLAAALG